MVDNFLTRLKDYFRKKTVAFYVAASVAVLSVVLSIVYACCYANTDYMSWAAFILTLVAGLAFFGLAVFRQTEAFAAPAMGLLDFIAFLLFIRAVYWYFSTVFYGGFKASLLGDVDPAFYACTVLYLITIIVSNVCVYLKNSKKTRDTDAGTEGEAESL